VAAHRRPEIPFSDADRGTCRWCGESILHERGPKRGEVNRRRRWHPKCVRAYNATDPRVLRRRIKKRDRGICAKCGLDTEAVRRKVRGPGRTQKLRSLGFVPRRSLWDLDHTLPLIDGGTHEETNLQTLCAPCHREKSAGEARMRAQARRDAEPEGPTFTPPRRRVKRRGGAEPDAREHRDRDAEPDAKDHWERLMARADTANARARDALDAR
jgi:5-methylcytosine-specific restriction endonuclease McrA